MKKFPFYRQLDAMDCGPTCLRMVSKHHGKSYSLQYLRDRSYLDREGVSLKGISEAAESIGFRTMAVKVSYGNNPKEPCLLAAPLPAIAHWNQNHFIVVYKVTKDNVWIADPGAGKFKLPRKEFEKHWLSDQDKGVLLLLDPGLAFYENEDSGAKKMGFLFLKSYLLPFKRMINQLFIGLILSSVFSLIFPFLTQSVVDIGIQNQNIGFIYLVLIGQLMLFFAETVVSFIQRWILLHIGIRMNVSLINDFLIKLMQLPLGFFDAKMTGDLLQRIGDHRRIESFLTQSTLSVILSVFNLLIFSIVLLVYSVPIFLIFLVASILYVSWIAFFLKKRKEIDYRAFQQHSANQDSLIEIIQGMPEIKLQGSQQKRRWRWAEIQAKLFKVQISSLSIAQYQDAGALSITRLKDILITFIAAKAVVDGQMTLGMMLAIQYIIGQLNAPLQQFIGFIRDAQDAKISLERLNEIHEKENEEDENVVKSATIPSGDIIVENLSFRYSPITEKVLEGINVRIPEGKVTAIVGTSGSGKTTLLKLILGFYAPTSGYIKIGHTDLQNARLKIWRDQCGVVMQEGFIFSDTIANNIAESDDRVDQDKLINAVNVANIRPFIEMLPLGYNTMIGAKGNGISQGQRQRIFIARAVYKDPTYIFFDEATNSLDANNEKVIMENLEAFFENRTVIVVAHRLSTVKNADQIIVLEGGKVAESGNHESLVEKRGAYYTLVKNQLELGN